MINWLHAQLPRPEQQWDPVPSSHATEYASVQWEQGVNHELLDEISGWTGGLHDKRVLDLGGGPGHYSIAFAKRGARVTWFDVSRNYERLARECAAAADVSIQFSIGYLDEAEQKLGEQFDLVFNRICWNYGRGDDSFARVVFSMIKPGGVAYIDTTHSNWRRELLPWSARARTWLNDQFGLKIGHPFPPHGRLARLFAAMPVEKLFVDYTSPHNDRIMLVRAQHRS